MGAGNFTAIKTERVTDTVYAILRERIVGQSLSPGSKINVEEIAKQLEVSRTPVHEALTILAADGLVEVRPRRGTFVTEFAARDYAEILDIRRALELLACETVCKNATEDNIRELELLVQKMEKAVRDAPDATEAARIHDALNLEFHTRLIDLSDNRRLIVSYKDLRAHLRIARAHVDATEWLQRVPIETREHSVILHALAKRDVEEMKSALDTHLRRSAASLTEDVTRTEGRKSTHTSRQSAAPAAPHLPILKEEE